MDFVSLLTEELSQHPITPQNTAQALNKAALRALQYGVKGDLTDTLTKEQAALLLAALQWNLNPLIRQGVKEVK